MPDCAPNERKRPVNPILNWTRGKQRAAEGVPKPTGVASSALGVITPNGYRIVVVARFEAEDLCRGELTPAAWTIGPPSLKMTQASLEYALYKEGKDHLYLRQFFVQRHKRRSGIGRPVN